MLLFHSFKFSHEFALSTNKNKVKLNLFIKNL